MGLITIVSRVEEPGFFDSFKRLAQAPKQILSCLLLVKDEGLVVPWCFHQGLWGSLGLTWVPKGSSPTSQNKNGYEKGKKRINIWKGGTWRKRWVEIEDKMHTLGSKWLTPKFILKNLNWYTFSYITFQEGELKLLLTHMNLELRGAAVQSWNPTTWKADSGASQV